MRTMHIMRAKLHIFFDIRKHFPSIVTFFNTLYLHCAHIPLWFFLATGQKTATTQKKRLTCFTAETSQAQVFKAGFFLKKDELLP